MIIRDIWLKTALTAVGTLSFASQAPAAELMVNGGFETGDYTGWLVNVFAGSSGNLNVVANNGGNSPISSFPYQLNANGGRWFSITDQSGPGAYSLMQSFVVAQSGMVKISFDKFANNQAGVNINGGLDFNANPTQHARADILFGGAAPFTDNPLDIAAVLWGPGSDSLTGNPNPWVTVSNTVFLAAGVYYIRFAEADNQLFYQFGIDNVSVNAAIPEASTWAMMILGFSAMGFAMRNRKRAVATA
jgi:hypothetical protein